MAEMTEQYMGIEMFGQNDEKIGTVVGLLTADDRRQFYVVESGGFLGMGKSSYYIPAERGIATNDKRLDVDVTTDQLSTLGWDHLPEGIPSGASLAL